ncbi:MAG: 2-amino-4-hydroxy-6-hydroxymethyldihydropteridine diphosphokinase [Opitutales bacterium]
MPIAYIALGSNLGDRLGRMLRALELLEQIGVSVLRTSPVYENRAIGMGKVAVDFLNSVVEVKSDLAPMPLLEACLEIEQNLGRIRSGDTWLPRTIDLDLLYIEGVEMNEKRLTLPHPRIAERDFVAVPLADLVPDLKIAGQEVREMVEALSVNELRLYPEAL